MGHERDSHLMRYIPHFHTVPYIFPSLFSSWVTPEPGIHNVNGRYQLNECLLIPVLYPHGEVDGQEILEELGTMLSNSHTPSLLTITNAFVVGTIILVLQTKSQAFRN